MGRLEQLSVTEKRESSYRDQELACGETIPNMPEDS
jgi:hypothetical protein